jgi:uncharacterized protein
MQEKADAYPASVEISSLRRWLYPILVLTIIVIWAIYMTAGQHWRLFQDFWGLSLTMLFGSFIAGATPQGGSAVAFPVFTKVFQIPSSDARTFGLMIQAVGMSMASITIILRRVKILPRVILWTTIGGAIGLLLGTYILFIPPPLPKVLFTLLLSVFGIALFISRWLIHWKPCLDMPSWTQKYTLSFLLIGTIGGIFAAYTGAGADALTFVVLTLAFGIDEKISTPTTIIIMALNSVIGFFLHAAVSQDIGMAWNYWLVTIPIVIVGAPLGSFVLSLITRDMLIIGILLLIGTEALSTILLVPFSATIIQITGLALLISSVTFWLMLYYRHHYIARR